MKHERHPHDFYATPRPFVEASLDLLPALTPRRILDPGAGDGMWGMVARERWPDAHILGYEIRDVPWPAAYASWTVGGADYLGMVRPNADLVIGNPPYSLAEAFVRAALHDLFPGGYLVFLLRLSFLETQGRHKGLWKQFPPQIVGVFADRPSFTSNGDTDNVGAVAVVWQQGWTGDTTLRFISSTQHLGEQEVLL
jgi:hypothetical protein